jgi:ABC-type transport system involved in multi-copper enzyme maturation permease subunit
MKKLIAIEYLKLRKLTSLKVILLIYAVISPLAIYAISSFITNFMQPFLPDDWSALNFPDIWGVAAYSASYFNVLMGVLVIIVLSNEYTYKTFKQHVIDGLSISQVIWSKFFVVIALSTIVTAYTFVTGLIFGWASGSSEPFYNGLSAIGLYYIQTVCYFSLAFLFAVLLKRTAVSIIVFILSFLVETIIGITVSYGGFQTVYAYMPLNTFSKLTPFPILKQMIKAGQERNGNVPVILDTSVNILISGAYMIVFFAIAFWVVKRRDL